MLVRRLLEARRRRVKKAAIIPRVGSGLLLRDAVYGRSVLIYCKSRPHVIVAYCCRVHGCSLAPFFDILRVGPRGPAVPLCPVLHVVEVYVLV